MKRILFVFSIIIAVAFFSFTGFAGEIRECPEVIEITDIQNNDVFEIVDTVKTEYDDVRRDIYDASRSSWSLESGKISEHLPVDWVNMQFWYPNDTSYNDGYRLESPRIGNQRFVDIDGEPIRFATSDAFDVVLKRYVNYSNNNSFCEFAGHFRHYNLGYVFFSENMQDKVAYTAMYNVVNNKFYHFPIVYTYNGRTDGPYERYHMSAFDENGYAMLYKTKVWPGGLPGNTLFDNTAYRVKIKNPPVVSVKFNGEKIGFDQVPVIESGRTLVPLRAIFEKIGAEVSWDNKTRTVSAVKDGISVMLTIDKLDATVNGSGVALDVPAKIINGRTMVPVRFVSDCFGVNVEWNAGERCVYLVSAGE